MHRPSAGREARLAKGSASSNTRQSELGQTSCGASFPRGRSELGHCRINVARSLGDARSLRRNRQRAWYETE